MLAGKLLELVPSGIFTLSFITTFSVRVAVTAARDKATKLHGLPSSRLIGWTPLWFLCVQFLDVIHPSCCCGPFTCCCEWKRKGLWNYHEQDKFCSILIWDFESSLLYLSLLSPAFGFIPRSTSSGGGHASLRKSALTKKIPIFQFPPEVAMAEISQSVGNAADKAEAEKQVSDLEKSVDGHPVGGDQGNVS